MKLIGYVYGKIEAPIFMQHGRYYLLTSLGYKSFGSKTIINKYLKDNSLKILKIN